MESKKNDSRTFKKESTLFPKLDLKESSMLRITKRQLLKEKADKQLVPKNSRGAEVSGDGSEDEEDDEDYEMRRGITGNKVGAASDADADDYAVEKTSALKALADKFTVGGTDQQSDTESTGEGSTMARNSGDIDLVGLSELSAAQQDTKKSENPVTMPTDMYLIESVKGDRMLKTVGGLVPLISLRIWLTLVILYRAIASFSLSGKDMRIREISLGSLRRPYCMSPSRLRYL